MHKISYNMDPGERTIGKAQQIMIDNQVEELSVIHDDEFEQGAGNHNGCGYHPVFNRKLSTMKSWRERGALAADKKHFNLMTCTEGIEKDLLTIAPSRLW